MVVVDPLTRLVKEASDHIKRHQGQIAEQNDSQNERSPNVEQYLLQSFVSQVLFILKLHPRASETVVVFVVVCRVCVEADPAELVFALFAFHVVAAFRFFDGGFAIRALSTLHHLYLILKVSKVWSITFFIA